ncbi:MAG: diguanylate cyclase [Acidobacteriota bacterium]
MARADHLTDWSTRLFRAAARARNLRGLLAAVGAALRLQLPGARVDVLFRDSSRSWTSLSRWPLVEPELAPWPPPPPEPGMEARRDWDLPLPPRQVQVKALGESERHPGDAELLAQGHRSRLMLPLRVHGLRVVVSAAWKEDELPSDATVEAMASSVLLVLRPAFERWGELRRLHRKLDRSRRHADRSRFVQRLTAGLHRSLAVADIFRTVVDRLRRLLPLTEAWMAVPEGEHEAVLHELTEDDGFRRTRSSQRPIEDFPELTRAPVTEDRELDDDDEGDDDEQRHDGADHGADDDEDRVTLPLLARRRVVGLLGLRTEEGALAGEALSLLRHVAGPLAVAVENAKLYHEVSERSRLMTALHEVGNALGSAADRRDVTDTVLSILHDTFRFQHSAVLMLEADDEGKEWLVLQASRGYSARKGSEGRFALDSGGITSEAARTGKLVHVADVRRDERYIQGVESGRSEVAVPLVAGGRLQGVLDVESTEVNAFHPEHLETLQLFSTQVALALQRASLFEEIRRQAMTDGLTGLLNQRYFTEKLDREFRRSTRTGRPFTLVLMDLDDLKGINDLHGHPVGNQAISAVGRALREHVRSMDAAARFGGDEFALVLSETGVEGASILIDRVRAQIAAAPVLPERPVTVSAGLTEWREEVTSSAALIAEADRALYRAKSEGKDRAMAADEVTATD